MQAWAALTLYHKCINFQQIEVASTKWIHWRNSRALFRVTTHFHLLHSDNFKTISNRSSSSLYNSSTKTSSKWRHSRIIKLFWWQWIICLTITSSSNCSYSSRFLWLQLLHLSLIECSKSSLRSFSTSTPFSSNVRILMVSKTLMQSLSTHLSSILVRAGSSPNEHKRV